MLIKIDSAAPLVVSFAIGYIPLSAAAAPHARAAIFYASFKSSMPDTPSAAASFPIVSSRARLPWLMILFSAAGQTPDFLASPATLSLASIISPFTFCAFTSIFPPPRLFSCYRYYIALYYLLWVYSSISFFSFILH